MKLIIDSREQRPFAFANEKYGVTVEHGPLSVGDYSLAGLADRVAVERKSLPDLVTCLGRERERFERELQRGAALDTFMVVVEASWADLASGSYRSAMNAHAACQSVLAFSCRYRLPFLFAGSRSNAEYVTWGFLRQYLESARKRYRAIVRAHGEALAGPLSSSETTPDALHTAA
ncbi:ERCC4 domain-containing protein [Desulfocurvus sp. DL9XJH121]